MKFPVLLTVLCWVIAIPTGTLIGLVAYEVVTHYPF